MAEYVAEALSRNDIRKLAWKIRELFNLKDPYFPVMSFLEHIMPKYFLGFHYEIVETDYFPRERHAEINVITRVITIREDIYDGAVNGNGRDRMTVMHEIAHYILIIAKGVKLNRSFEKTPIKSYYDPEWQAKALAGEILCPAEYIKNLTPTDISKLCGVSLKAAKYNLLKAKKGGTQ